MRATIMPRCGALITGCLLVVSVSADERTVLFTIPKMSSAECQVVVTDALKGVEGVRKVSAAYSTKSAYVTYEDRKTNLEALKKATAREGYPVSDTVETRRQ